MRRNLWCSVGLMAVAAWTGGCRNPCCCIDRYAASASTPVDLTPGPAVARAPDRLEGQPPERVPAPTGSVQPTAYNQSTPGGPGARGQFEIPRGIPGADAPPLRMPPTDATQSPRQRESLMARIFPDVAGAPIAPDTESGDLYTLADLQQIAIENSPVVRQAAAKVEQARGLAIQAGLCPNPVIGYEGDTIPTGATAGYNGLFINQELVTAGKLTYAQNAAAMEMRARQHELRRARVQLANAVRRGYFDVLLAQEQLRFNQSMAELTNQVYQAQIDLVAVKEAAAYEPLQLRVLAVQARNSVIQADNRRTAAWRSLAATLGVPGMPRGVLEGSIEMDAPRIDHEAALALLLRRHTDLAAGQARVGQAGQNLRLQEVTPIPNLLVYSALQHDDTTPLNHMSFNVQIGVPVPLFDKNQGNIVAARGQLAQARQDWIATRNDLESQLAEAFGRYQASLEIVGTYRTDILNDQVRVYRGVYDRFRLAGETVDFAQVVVAQQTLFQAVTGYLQTMGDLWTATVDVAELLQVDDLFAMESFLGGPSPNADIDGAFQQPLPAVGPPAMAPRPGAAPLPVPSAPAPVPAAPPPATAQRAPARPLTRPVSTLSEPAPLPANLQVAPR